MGEKDRVELYQDGGCVSGNPQTASIGSTLLVNVIDICHGGLNFEGNKKI